MRQSRSDHLLIPAALAALLLSAAGHRGTTTAATTATTTVGSSGAMAAAATIAFAASSADTLVIGAGGDLMLGSWLTAILDARGSDYPWRDLAPVLSRADLLIGNLESPFLDDTTRVARAQKTYTFAVPSRHAAVLHSGGFGAVTLANNHILDFGLTGLERTWEVLENAGIVHAGTGSDKAEAHTHSVVSAGGRRIALLAYNHVFPAEFWAGEDRPGTAHALDEPLAAEVRRARADADLVVVSFHWSEEGRETPKEYQQILARIAVDNGADLVVGHHPHVLQTLEWYRGRLIAYSLGNLVFASYTPAPTGALLLVAFTEDRIASAEFHPVDVNNYRRHFRPSPISPEAWPVLGSAVVATLADSARAGAEGISIQRNAQGGWFRLLPPDEERQPPQ